VLDHDEPVANCHPNFRREALGHELCAAITKPLRGRAGMRRKDTVKSCGGTT
jgi:hypothetical protein